MKIAVTGGTGQVGLPLVLELVKQGHSLRVMIHNRKTGLENLPVELMNGSTFNPEDCDNLCKGMECSISFGSNSFHKRQSKWNCYENKYRRYKKHVRCLCKKQNTKVGTF